MIQSCELCPRSCHVNRLPGERGYCGGGNGFEVASVCVHFGEEPPLSGDKGVCNVFFRGCVLQCVYCQNHSISDNLSLERNSAVPFERLIELIESCLDRSENMLGFVSPTHNIPQLIKIMEELHRRGRRPVVVYNTGGYDTVSTIRSLEGLVDVYLPDLKYCSPEKAALYSGAEDYPDRAFDAVGEMMRQKGSSLVLDDDGRALSGIIIRHLILPGEVEESKGVLRRIACELSVKLHVSLMSQYYPAVRQAERIGHLSRCISRQEYDEVVSEFYSLGFSKGWVQEHGSSALFRPDFSAEDPFEGQTM